MNKEICKWKIQWKHEEVEEDKLKEHDVNRYNH